MDDNQVLNSIETFLQKSLKRIDLPADFKADQEQFLEQITQLKLDTSLRGSIYSSSDNPDNVPQSSIVHQSDSLLRSSFHGNPSQNQKIESNNSAIIFNPQLPPRYSQEHLNELRGISWNDFDDDNKNGDNPYDEICIPNKNANSSKSSTWRSNSYPTLPLPRSRQFDLSDRRNNFKRRNSGDSSTSYESYEEEGDQDGKSSSIVQSDEQSQSDLNKQKSPTNFQKPVKWESKSQAILDPPVAQYKEKKRKKSLKINLQSMISAIPAINLAPNTTMSRKSDPLPYRDRSSTNINTNTTSSLLSNKVSATQLSNHSDSFSLGTSHMSGDPSASSLSSTINTQQYGSSNEKRRCMSVSDCGVKSKSAVSNQLVSVLFLYGAAVFVLDKLNDRHYVLKIDFWEDNTVFVALENQEDLNEWKNNLIDVIAKITFDITARRLSANHRKSNAHSSHTSMSSNANSEHSSTYYSCPPLEKRPSSIVGTNTALSSDGMRVFMRDAKRRVSQIWNNISKRKSSRSFPLHRGTPALPGKQRDDASSIYSGPTRSVYYQHLEDNPSGVTMAGNLMVQSSTLGDDNWHCRFCLVSRGMFTVYKRKEDLKPQINFPLFGCNLDSDPSAINRCIIIIIQGKQKKVAIEASDWWCLGQWMNALVRVTSQVAPPPSDDEDDDFMSFPSQKINSLSEEAIVKRMMEAPSQTDKDYETTINDQLLIKLSAVRQHLLRSSSKYGNDHGPAAHKQLELTCSTLPNSDNSTHEKRMKRKRSDLLKRSYESVRMTTRPILDNMEEDSSCDKLHDNLSSEMSSNYSLDCGIARGCYSTEELNSPMKNEQLCLRAANDLLPSVFRQRLQDLKSSPIFANNPALTNNDIPDYELVSAPFRPSLNFEFHDDENQNSKWDDDQRDSVISRSSFGLNRPLSESQSGLYIAGAACSSTSAYSSMYHPQSRPDSSHMGDLNVISIPFTESEHEDDTESRGNTLLPTMTTNQESEYSEALDLINKKHPELLPNTQKDSTLRPPLPVRSKTRRSMAAAELEAMATKIGRHVRKYCRQSSHLMSQQHHQSLSNVSMSAMSDISGPCGSPPPSIFRSRTDTNLDQQTAESTPSIPSQISTAGPKASSIISRLKKKRNSITSSNSLEKSSSLKRHSSAGGAFSSFSSIFTPSSRRKKTSKQLDHQIKEELDTDCEEEAEEQDKYTTDTPEPGHQIITSYKPNFYRKVQSLSQLDFVWLSESNDREKSSFAISVRQISNIKNQKLFSSDINLSSKCSHFDDICSDTDTTPQELCGRLPLSDMEISHLHCTLLNEVPERSDYTSKYSSLPGTTKQKPARPDKPPQYASLEKRMARLSITTENNNNASTNYFTVAKEEELEEPFEDMFDQLPDLTSIPAFCEHSSLSNTEYEATNFESSLYDKDLDSG